jgi:hypothetical protein
MHTPPPAPQAQTLGALIGIAAKVTAGSLLGLSLTLLLLVPALGYDPGPLLDKIPLLRSLPRLSVRASIPEEPPPAYAEPDDEGVSTPQVDPQAGENTPEDAGTLHAAEAG